MEKEGKQGSTMADIDEIVFEFPGADEVNARIERETGKTLAQMLEETSISDVLEILEASGE